MTQAADWRSGSRWSILSVLCPVHPFPLRGTSPQGKTRDLRRKNSESYTSRTISAFSPFGGWRYHLARWEACHMTQKSKSRNVLASPLGEESHEVAKGWTVVIPIMILDVDVTAERRHYNTHCPLMGSLCTAPLRGPPIGCQENDRVSYLCSAPYTLLPLRGISPQGETRDMRDKNSESYTSCTIPVCPPLVARHHLSPASGGTMDA